MSSPAPASGSHRRFTLFALAFVLLLAFAAWLFRNTLLGPQLPVERVAASHLTQTVVASGRVMTRQRVSIAAEITGRVNAVPVDEGQIVARNDVLIEIDDRDARASMALARATVAQAQARLRQIRETELPGARETLRQAQANADQARKQYERDRDLRTRGFIGEAEFDQAKKALDIATSQLTAARLHVQANDDSGTASALALAALDQARANLQLAQIQLDQSVILAPTNGTLIARQVEPGNVVQPGRELMTLAADGDMQVEVRVDERNLARIAIGQRAVGSADAFPEQRFSALVHWISPAIDAARGSVDVRLRVADAPENLRQDMTVSVTITTAQRDRTITVPNEAISKTESRAPGVFVIRDGHAQRANVTIGLRGDTRSEILNGLQADDLVTISAGEVVNGQRARPALPELQ